MKAGKGCTLPGVQKQAGCLLAKFEFESAEFLLRNALQEWPNDATLHVQLGTVLSYTDREDEALCHLQRSGKNAQARALGQLLLDHFHCRHLSAVKTGIRDAEGLQSLEAAQALHGGHPGDVGVALSACLIVKNEEAALENCLLSIAGLVDEIVVVDTGSTDGTIGIAERFGAKVGRFEWCDDFSAARNAALDMATGRWALWIDADETLSEDSERVIREAVARPHFGGFAIPIVNFMADSGTAEQYVHAPVRLFQIRPGVRFTGKIHEQITPSLSALGLPNGVLKEATIFHEGYRPAVMHAKDKLNRTLQLLESEVREHPNDSFQWFNLASALAVAERYEEAEHACRASIRLLNPAEQHARTVHQVLLEVLERSGRFSDALEAAAETRRLGLGTLLTEFTVANVEMKAGRLNEALASIERCVGMTWPSDLQGDRSIASYKRYVLRAQILALLGKHDEAIRDLDMALSVDESYPPAIFILATIHERKGNYERALQFFGRLHESPGLQTSSLQGSARCSLALGRKDDAMALFERGWHWEPGNLEAWVEWVNAAEAVGDSRYVLAAFESYARDREPSVEMFINWGRALEATGDLEKALTCFSEAIKRNPSDANAYFNCGDLLYKMERFADAAHIYESGLRQAPMNPQGWFVLGNTLLRMELADGARLAYRQCLAIEPGHAGATNNLDFLESALSQATG